MWSSSTTTPPTGRVTSSPASPRGDRRIHLIRRDRKRGLGSAYRTAFAWALEREYARVVVMDADRSHDPAEIGHLLEAADRADVVVGSRYVPGGRIENWPWSRRALSGGANALARIMVGREVHDWTAGFKCYGRAALASLDLDRIRSEGYSFQVEILFHCRRAGWKIQEVPITFVDRRLGRTKMSRREVYQAMVTLAAHRLAAPHRMSPGGAAAAPAPPRRWTPEAAVSALIAVTAAARVLIAWTTGLCFGESYYFSCALHPSLSYFDHPPLSILIGEPEPGARRRARPPPAPRPVHRALRRHHVAPVPARAPALRRVGGVLGGAPAEPLADLHAERGPLLPARRAR